MKAKSIATLLVASAVSLAAPAFAGGYGQTSVSRTDVDAPVSQRGQAAQTKAASEGQGSAAEGFVLAEDEGEVAANFRV